RSVQRALQVPGVIEVCVVILARMQDERRLLDFAGFALHRIDQPSMLENGAAGGIAQSGGSRITLGECAQDELADTVVLDPMRMKIGELDEVGEPLPADDLEQPHIPGN